MIYINIKSYKKIFYNKKYSTVRETLNTFLFLDLAQKVLFASLLTITCSKVKLITAVSRNIMSCTKPITNPRTRSN